jgi:hypothetical protein
MVTTVEPGLYMSPTIKGLAKRWWNIGVRIEDDVLVTADGHEVLSHGAPKSVAEIEALMVKAAVAKSTSARTKAVNDAHGVLQGFLDRLARFRVLDPACGSGAFLIHTLEYLLRERQRVQRELRRVVAAAAFITDKPRGRTRRHDGCATVACRSETQCWQQSRGNPLRRQHVHLEHAQPIFCVALLDARGTTKCSARVVDQGAQRSRRVDRGAQLLDTVGGGQVGLNDKAARLCAECCELVGSASGCNHRPAV